MNWVSTLLICYSLFVGKVIARKEDKFYRRLSRHHPSEATIEATIPQEITGEDGAESEARAQGLSGIKALAHQETNPISPPAPPREWPFANASYFFNNTDHINIISNEPLNFNNVFSQNVTYTDTRLIVQIDGLYRVSVAVNNFLLNSTVIAHVWQNGIQIPDVSFIIEVGAPLGVADGITVPAKVNDYFELVVDVPSLIGIPGLIAYSLVILQISES